MAAPFTVVEARERGLERWHLRSRRRWRRVGPALYVPADGADDPMIDLDAAARRLPDAAAFGGLTAAWLHGLHVEPCNPVDVIAPKGTGISARSGMRVSRARLPADEVTSVRGHRATTVVRTLEDLGRRMSLIDATVIADMALNARLVDVTHFRRWANSRAGGRGLVNLRRVASLVEPKAGSQMETRLRLVFVLGGLPVPEAQVPIYDANGFFAGRPDLYYPRERLAIEYDGAVHKRQLAEDNQRQNRLMQAGVRLLRFTAVDVFEHPEKVVAQARAMLAA